MLSKLLKYALHTDARSRPQCHQHFVHAKNRRNRCTVFIILPLLKKYVNEVAMSERAKNPLS